MKKRTNPLDVSTDESVREQEETPVTEEPVTIEATPVAAEQMPVTDKKEIAPVIKEEAPAAERNIIEEAKPVMRTQMQRRVNPLTLEVVSFEEAPEAVSAAKESETKEIVLPLPCRIFGKSKKKFVFTMLNKNLILAAQAASGKKAGEVLETALLQYLFTQHADAYRALEQTIKENGCEIR